MITNNLADNVIDLVGVAVWVCLCLFAAQQVVTVKWERKGGIFK
jgi:hypothetical protein